MGMRPQDMRKLMQQAQQMQEQMASAQEQLASQTFEGSAGGGVVRATVSGSGMLVAVQIDASVIDPDDPELLEDLVMAAVNQGLTAAAEAAQTQMGGITGGLDLGGLLG